MASISYPDEEDFRIFIDLILNGNYSIKKYLPNIDDEWYKIIVDCIEYIRHTSYYEDHLDLYDIASKILYKVAKRHELGDGNKRSGVMAVVIFCLVNDYYIDDPKYLKSQAKRVAMTRGRINEYRMRSRVKDCLKKIMLPLQKNN